MATVITYKTTPAGSTHQMVVKESVADVLRTLNNSPTDNTWVQLTITDDRGWGVKPNMVVEVMENRSS